MLVIVFKIPEYTIANESITCTVYRWIFEAILKRLYSLYSIRIKTIRVDGATTTWNHVWWIICVVYSAIMCCHFFVHMPQHYKAIARCFLHKPRRRTRVLGQHSDHVSERPPLTHSAHNSFGRQPFNPSERGQVKALIQVLPTAVWQRLTGGLITAISS